MREKNHDNKMGLRRTSGTSAPVYPLAPRTPTRSLSPALTEKWSLRLLERVLVLLTCQGRVKLSAFAERRKRSNLFYGSPQVLPCCGGASPGDERREPGWRSTSSFSSVESEEKFIG